MPKDEDREEGYRAQARSFLEPERTPTEVRIEMLDDERERARKLIEQNNWKEDEGLHIVFSRGLVALERETAGGAEHEGKRLIDAKTPEEREQLLLARLSELESRYSVMKFTSFNALRDNETLRMNVTGLTAEYKALAEQNKYLRGREDELRARADLLEREVAALEARLRASTPEQRSRWERIKALLRAVVE